MGTARMNEKTHPRKQATAKYRNKPENKESVFFCEESHFIPRPGAHTTTKTSPVNTKSTRNHRSPAQASYQKTSRNPKWPFITQLTNSTSELERVHDISL